MDIPALPKVELHVQLDGSLSYAAVSRLILCTLRHFDAAKAGLKRQIRAGCGAQRG